MFVHMFVCRGIFKHWHYHMANYHVGVGGADFIGLPLAFCKSDENEACMTVG